MSVNRFEAIKRFLHFADNQQMPRKSNKNYDKLYKVRVLLESLVTRCRSATAEEHNSIDEQMIQTKSRSGIRQYLPKKPHKWGLKVWARCGISGFCYDFDVSKSQ